MDRNLEPTHEPIEIYTLGRFIVKQGDSILSDEKNRSYKLWEFFKYMLTNRKKAILPETIMENLWPDHEYTDAKRALRALVYRLRNLLEENPGGTGVGSLVFSQGGYMWKPSTSCWLDVEEFEDYNSKAQTAKNQDSDQAMYYFRRVIDLYKGDYLPESSFSEWIITARNYYRRTYLKCVNELLEMMEIRKQYEEIVALCERVFTVEPYEEDIHLYYLEALAQGGKFKVAKSHYEYITAALYRELGVKPSPEMRNLYRKMSQSDPSVEFDLAQLQDNITDQEDYHNKAFVCDADGFKMIYRLERRRLERSGQSVYLALMTLAQNERTGSDIKSLKTAMDVLKDVLVSTLRKGDTVCQWNEKQFLLMLPGLTLEQGDIVIDRLEKSFKSTPMGRRYEIKTKIEPVIPL